MSKEKIYPVPEELAARAWANKTEYRALYQSSIDDPVAFWGEQAKRLDWIKPFTEVKDVSYDAEDLRIRWFGDGELNVSANCLDRHLETRGDQTAIIWEGDDPGEDARISYREQRTEKTLFVLFPISK